MENNLYGNIDEKSPVYEISSLNTDKVLKTNENLLNTIMPQPKKEGEQK